MKNGVRSIVLVLKAAFFNSIVSSLFVVPSFQVKINYFA